MKPQDAAPDFDITLVDGKTTKFYDLAAGKTTVLFFYPSSASYSKTCQKQAAAFNEKIKAFGDKVQVIGVAIGDLDELRKFKEKFASNFPVGLIDKETQKLYDTRRTGVASFLSMFFDIMASKRVTFIIDPQHKVLERMDLAASANGPQMTAHVEEVAMKLKALEKLPVQSPISKDSKEWVKEVNEKKPEIEKTRG